MEEMILKALNDLNGRFDKLEGRFDKLEDRFDKLEGRFDKFEDKFDKLDVRVGSLESKVDENTQILKALEHLAQVNNAEHDKMGNDIAHIKGNTEAIKKDLYQVELVTSNNWNEITKLKAVK